MDAPSWLIDVIEGLVNDPVVMLIVPPPVMSYRLPPPTAYRPSPERILVACRSYPPRIAGSTDVPSAAVHRHSRGISGGPERFVHPTTDDPSDDMLTLYPNVLPEGGAIAARLEGAVHANA
jgi:hypothetical protein